MATKPTVGHLEWIEDDDADKFLVPSDTKKLQGWVKEEKPPFQYFNWAWRLIDRWLQYLVSETDEHLAYVKSVGGIGATGVVTITYADSPHDVAATTTLLRVDCTAGAVIANFPSGANTLARRIKVKKIDETTNAAQYVPYDEETIEGESESYDSVMPGEIMEFAPIGATGYERIG